MFTSIPRRSSFICENDSQEEGDDVLITKNPRVEKCAVDIR